MIAEIDLLFTNGESFTRKILGHSDLFLVVMHIFRDIHLMDFIRVGGVCHRLRDISRSMHPFVWAVVDVNWVNGSSFVTTRFFSL